MPVRVDPALVGPQEIAALLDVHLTTVYQWRQRQVLPAPEWTISGVPIWQQTTIEQWAADTGRRKDA